MDASSGGTQSALPKRGIRSFDAPFAGEDTGTSCGFACKQPIYKNAAGEKGLPVTLAVCRNIMGNTTAAGPGAKIRFGHRVLEITPESPSAEALLVPYLDVIVAINDVPLVCDASSSSLSLVFWHTNGPLRDAVSV